MTASFAVFVCSTFSDLSKEREDVLDAIRRLKLQHDSMEFFGARAEQPIETCLAEVRQSDVLVVIVAHRYGSIVPNLGVSYSEAEYSEGYRLKKPCLVYMRDDNVPILPRHMERDPAKLELLAKWKSTLQLRHTVATFQDGSELAVQVAADLSRTIQDLEKVAEARAASRSKGTRGIVGELAELVSDALGRGVPEASLVSAIRNSVSTLLAAGHRAPKVFLSFSHADLKMVRQVADGLTSAGLRVSLGSTFLAPGASMREIERELATADFVVFFISPSSLSSERAGLELQVALHRQVSREGGAALLPVLLEDADVPPLLRQHHWLDLRDRNIEKGLQLLVDRIRHASPARERRDPQGTDGAA